MSRVILLVLCVLLASAYVSAQAFNVGVVVANGTGNQTNETNGTVKAKDVVPDIRHPHGTPPAIAYDFPLEIWAKPGTTNTTIGTISNPTSTAHTISLRVDGTRDLVIHPTSTTVPSGGSLQVTLEYTPSGRQAVSATVYATDGNVTEPHTITLLPDVPADIIVTINMTNDGEFRIYGLIETVRPIDIHAEIRDPDGTVRRTYDSRHISGREELEWGADLAGLAPGTYQGCLVVESESDVQESCKPLVITEPQESFPLARVLNQGPILLLALIILIVAACVGLYRAYFVMK